MDDPETCCMERRIYATERINGFTTRRALLLAFRPLAEQEATVEVLHGCLENYTNHGVWVSRGLRR